MSFWAEEKEQARDWALRESADGSQSGYGKEWELGEDWGEHPNGIDFFLVYYAGFFKVE